MQNTVYLTSRQMKAMLGNVCDMTLWRWQRDPALGFPSPVKIKSRNYWRESDVAAWLESRAEAAD